MNVILLTIALVLTVLADVSNATGSVALVLMRDQTDGTSAEGITKAPYTDLIELLRTAESELLLTRTALNSQSVKAGDGCRACTQERIEETATRIITDTVMPIFRQALARAYISNGWTVAGNYVFKHFNERVSYQTATQRCNDLGGRLATEILRHPDAVKFIIDQKYIVTYTNGTAPWVGLDALQTGRQFRWIDGGQMNPETTAWNPGEPNNSGGIEECGQLWVAHATKVTLNDGNCAYGVHYICEIKLI